MPDDAKSMPLSGHLEELRARLLTVVLATGAVFLICMVFYRDIWELAMLPRERAAAWLGQDADKLFPLQFMRPLEGLSSAVSIALKAAVIITFPIIISQIWLFVSPALTPREKRLLVLMFGGGSVLFFAGGTLAFLYATPTGLAYLTQFDTTLTATVTQWRVDAYLDFIFMTCIGFGLGFELPLVMAGMTAVGLLTPQMISGHWRTAVFAMLVCGAIFTPPDPYTMLFLSACLVALFWLGYGLSRLIAGREEETEETAVATLPENPPADGPEPGI